MDQINPYLETLIRLRNYEARFGVLPRRWFVDRYTMAELIAEALRFCYIKDVTGTVTGGLKIIGVEIVERKPW